jgi:catechol 2,3-dioxygenase-like lactoylglutathione lyase family enzyme
MTGVIECQITFLGTTDLAATADFYERVVGLELALDQGTCRIYATGEGAFIGFCQRATKPNPEGVILTLVTQDVDGWYELLSARGVEFEKPPAQNTDYQIYHCLFRDPNGYLVEIQRFEDPRWRRPETD